MEVETKTKNKLYVWIERYIYIGALVSTEKTWQYANFLTTDETIENFRKEMKSRGICTLLVKSNGKH